jgi:hypothetical protein
MTPTSLDDQLALDRAQTDHFTSEDDTAWAERSAYWQQQATWKPRHPHQKRKVRSPLVLGGHGVRLRIDGGSLFVQNGFSHFPQKREEWRFFPGHPDLPSRIVVVGADGALTFDVLEWLFHRARRSTQVRSGSSYLLRTKYPLLVGTDAWLVGRVTGQEYAKLEAYPNLLGNAIRENPGSRDAMRPPTASPPL